MKELGVERAWRQHERVEVLAVFRPSSMTSSSVVRAVFHLIFILCKVLEQLKRFLRAEVSMCLRGAFKTN